MLRNCLIGLAAATMTVTPAAARDRTYDSQGRYIEPRPTEIRARPCRRSDQSRHLRRPAGWSRAPSSCPSSRFSNSTIVRLPKHGWAN